MVPDVGNRELVTDEQDRHLHQVTELPGSQPVDPRGQDRQADDNQGGCPHHHDVPRDGKIQAEEVEMGQVDFAEGREFQCVRVEDVFENHVAGVELVSRRVPGGLRSRCRPLGGSPGRLGILLQQRQEEGHVFKLPVAWVPPIGTQTFFAEPGSRGPGEARSTRRAPPQTPPPADGSG